MPENTSPNECRDRELRANASEWARRLGVNRSTVSSWLSRAFPRGHNKNISLLEILYALKHGGNDPYQAPIDRLVPQVEE